MRCAGLAPRRSGRVGLGGAAVRTRCVSPRHAAGLQAGRAARCQSADADAPIRPGQRGMERIKEVEKLGFRRLIIPKGNLSGVKSNQLEVLPVTTLEQAARLAFD